MVKTIKNLIIFIFVSSIAFPVSAIEPAQIEPTVTRHTEDTKDGFPYFKVDIHKKTIQYLNTFNISLYEEFDIQNFKKKYQFKDSLKTELGVDFTFIEYTNIHNNVNFDTLLYHRKNNKYFHLKSSNNVMKDSIINNDLIKANKEYCLYLTSKNPNEAILCRPYLFSSKVSESNWGELLNFFTNNNLIKIFLTIFLLLTLGIFWQINNWLLVRRSLSANIYYLILFLPISIFLLRMDFQYDNKTKFICFLFILFLSYLPTFILYKIHTQQIKEINEQDKFSDNSYLIFFKNNNLYNVIKKGSELLALHKDSYPKLNPLFLDYAMKVLDDSLTRDIADLANTRILEDNGGYKIKHMWDISELLQIASTIFPMIGFLGTILGLIQNGISRANIVPTDNIALSLALFTTLFGILFGISAILLQFLISNIIKKYEAALCEYRNITYEELITQLSKK